MIKNTIPFVDLREKTLVDLLRAYPDKAAELIKASTYAFGIAARMASFIALPIMDRRSRLWLEQTQNPYRNEIESFTDVLDARGVYALNLSYEWGCTSGAYRTDETVSLLRVLDWPFPAMGKHVMVLLQKGKAGDFYNVTWPAMSGVFNAMAPGRFAAAINQAPMRMHGLGFAGDWFKNRLLLGYEEGLPPSHLLRYVFENAANYEEAKQLLTETPVAAPVIFTLTGVDMGEGCIIERLENAAEVRELIADQQVTTANHFTTSLAQLGNGWRPREIDSAGRYRQSTSILGYDLEQEHFHWLRAPIINLNTRLCMVSNAATRRLLVQGFEGNGAVTELFHLPIEHQEPETAREEQEEYDADEPFLQDPYDQIAV